MKKFKFDATTATLTISADFDKAIQNPHSKEYALYKQLTTDIPNLTVCRMTHKTPTSYTAQKSGEKFRHNPYKGITFDKMKRFISAVDDKNGSFIKEYDRLYAFAMAVDEVTAYNKEGQKNPDFPRRNRLFGSMIRVVAYNSLGAILTHIHPKSLRIVVCEGFLYSCQVKTLFAKLVVDFSPNQRLKVCQTKGFY